MFEWTKSQRAAIEAFCKFLDGPEQVFILKGAAGTGKTVLAREFVEILRKKPRIFRLMAPTGRAAFILSFRTGEMAFTIHRSIYSLSQLEPNNEDDAIDSSMHARFGLKKNNEDPMSAVYFVDESSMISDSFSENEAFSFGSGRLLKDLFKYADTRKLVFIGDNAQLPPVGMNFSPALDAGYLKEEYGVSIVESMLTEVVRQGLDSGILANANHIREWIAKKTFIEFRLKDAADFHTDNEALLPHYYSLSESKPSVNGVVIAYTNRQVAEYNRLIRSHYYGDDAQKVVKGELLMIVRNNYAYNVELFNGNIVRVESCKADNEVERRLVRVKVGKNRIEDVELVFRSVTIEFRANNEEVTLNVKILDSLLDNDESNVSNLVARALLVDFNNRLPERLKENMPAIRKVLRNKSGSIDELTFEYLEKLLNDPYYNAVLCKYGYAVTCHKAQGGEWQNVFVDMGRYGGTSNESYFRWAYTALTRASKQVWHYRSPDFDYMSNIVVEPIQSSNNIHISIYSDSVDFCESRLSRISDISGPRGLVVREDKSKNYQHRITFTDRDFNTATFILWYNSNGYSGKEILQNSTSEDFTALCTSILEKSFAPGIVPFSAPDRPFAVKLHQYITSLIDEIGIQLLNITQEQYQDVYHLKTDGLAKVSISYTARGNYTYMRLISSLGGDDLKLEEFRKRFM